MSGNRSAIPKRYSKAKINQQPPTDLYEAAVIAVRILQQHDCVRGDMNALEVEVRSSVTHILTLKKVKEWLNGGARTTKLASSLKLHILAQPNNKTLAKRTRNTIRPRLFCLGNYP
ncbi:MAG TPA: hypothetical protein VLB68_02410 [Pyrinomonadaceae bacterium]|nr:hypothetical protein [Pyrinomonadaceae bacterium]